jgi:hypothetical protein
MRGSQPSRRSRPRRPAAVAVALGLEVGLFTSPVAAIALQWRQQLMSGLARGTLEGVSCPSPLSCVAVGTQQLSTGKYTYQALVESWDGRTWEQDATSALTTTTSSLDGVSCTSPTSCVAVGVTGNLPVPTSSLHPFAEVLAGTKWEIVNTAKLPAGTYAALSSVSCSRAGSCVAVGSYLAEAGGAPAAQPALVEAYDGSTWALEKTPVIAGHSSFLTSVSCSPGAVPTSCTAVGSQSFDDKISGPVAYRSDGDHWKVLNTSGVPHSGPGFASVSCPLPTSCMAIGSEGGAFSELDDANKWSTVAMAKLPTPYAALSGISCAGTVELCEAVGYFYGGPTPTATLAERWDGHRWAVQSSPNASTPDLFAVSCSSPAPRLGAGYTAVGSLGSQGDLGSQYPLALRDPTTGGA